MLSGVLHERDANTAFSDLMSRWITPMRCSSQSALTSSL